MTDRSGKPQPKGIYAEPDSGTATPHSDLIRDLMNPRMPKNEMCHAAAREIKNLRIRLDPKHFESDLGDALGRASMEEVGTFDERAFRQAIQAELEAMDEVMPFKRIVPTDEEHDRTFDVLEEIRHEINDALDAPGADDVLHAGIEVLAKRVAALTVRLDMKGDDENR